MLAEALGEVLDCPAPVVSLQLQLLQLLREGVSRRPLELFTETDGRSNSRYLPSWLSISCWDPPVIAACCRILLYWGMSGLRSL